MGAKAPARLCMQVPRMLRAQFRRLTDRTSVEQPLFWTLGSRSLKRKVTSRRLCESCATEAPSPVILYAISLGNPRLAFFRKVAETSLTFVMLAILRHLMFESSRNV